MQHHEAHVHSSHEGPEEQGAQGAHGEHPHHTHGPDGKVSWRMAAQATLHCLTGCAIGEVLGMVIGTALGWGNVPTMVLAIALAFVFGYALTLRGTLRAGVGFKAVFVVTTPVNKWMIGRGKGHAVVHRYHH